jgi:hypothetical protein
LTDDAAKSSAYLEAVTAALLKQGVERISRVREVAVSSLEAVVVVAKDEAAGGSGLPGLSLLRATLAEPDLLVGIGSGATVPRLVQFLSVDRYCTPIFEGQPCSFYCLLYYMYILYSTHL